MRIEDKTLLVTGANRGIGTALVEEALRRGARRVYAGTRQPLSFDDGRVTPVDLDITDAAQIQRAVAQIGPLDVLINNAGLALYVELADRSAFEQQLAVNLFGTYDLTHAFIPELVRAHGAIVNNLSLNSLAPLSVSPAYSASKAAALSLTQSFRAFLSGQGVSVHAVLMGPVDTDMTRGLPVPKASPQSVSQAILDGVENGDEDIFPDPWSHTLAESWESGPTKTLERQFAAFDAAEPVSS